MNINFFLNKIKGKLRPIYETNTYSYINEKQKPNKSKENRDAESPGTRIVRFWQKAAHTHSQVYTNMSLACKLLTVCRDLKFAKVNSLQGGWGAPGKHS